MAEWVQILVVAFVAQLAVLPGEKGQFIIAGLATRYNPLVVVGAAASAFGGWTIFEIWFGQALQRLLSQLLLDGITAGLFLFFGVLLWQSMPDRQSDGTPSTDGGMPGVNGELTVFGRDLSKRYGTFVPIFTMMAAGEFGDKVVAMATGISIWETTVRTVSAFLLLAL